MSLLELVECAGDKFRESPSCVVCNNLGQKKEGLLHGRDAPNDYNVISYADVLKRIRCHERWLCRTVTDFCRDGLPNDSVVAYLSSNSVDLFLSLLACTSNSVPAIGALLNTRWTPKEMADALEVDKEVINTQSLLNSAPSVNNKGHRAQSTTVILYGPGFQSIAEQVVLQLTHAATCQPLPSFDLSSDLDKLDRVHDSANDSQWTQMQPGDMMTETSNQSNTRQTPQQWMLDMDMPAFVRWAENNKTNSSTDDDALIVFTSGTTSKAKGVRLGHNALAIQALAKREKPCEYSNRTILLASSVPLFHVGGLSSCLATFLVGGTLLFPQTYDKANSVASQGQASTKLPILDPKSNTPAPGGFDVSAVQSSLCHVTSPVNTLVVVPAMLVSLLALFSDQQPQPIYPHVSLILIGGQSASEKTIEQTRYHFPNAKIVQTYACTEAASSLTFWQIPPSVDVKEATTGTLSPSLPTGSCVGFPPDHIELQLFPEKEDGEPTYCNTDGPFITRPHQPGIIATRGPHVMNGYWKRGCRQSDVGKGDDSIAHDWFRTSDLGQWDERGQLHFCGRVNDVIRTGGETVLAQQVERVLSLHPDITECAVFAKADEKFGEAVACAIVIRPNRDNTNPLQLGSLKQWCEDHGLANYKRPRYMFLVASLPRNSSGKVLKHKLIQTYGRLQSKL